MKTCSLLVLLFGLTSFMASASTAMIVVNNDDPVDFVQSIPAPVHMISAAASQPIIGLSEKPEKVVLASLCASSSPNVVASRLLAMNGLFGLPVNTNPSDPTGWYVVESNGWQWSDILTSSTFALWRGKTSLLTPSQSGERGNRMVIHAMGQYPVSAYECEIATSLTNISTTRFPVGKDGAGNELPFSANFVGLSFGVNGVLESTRNPVSGSWTQVGDDIVFSNGERPSVVQYDMWVRFGATAVIVAGNVNSTTGVKEQFRAGMSTFTAKLFKNGQSVHVQTVTASQLRLSIMRGPVDPNPYDILKLEGGQQGTAYHLEYAYYPDGPWTQFDSDVFVEQIIHVNRVPDGDQFYRAVVLSISPQ